jgi:hypothetical protein
MSPTPSAPGALAGPAEDNLDLADAQLPKWQHAPLQRFRCEDCVAKIASRRLRCEDCVAKIAMRRLDRSRNSGSGERLCCQLLRMLLLASVCTARLPRTTSLHRRRLLPRAHGTSAASPKRESLWAIQQLRRRPTHHTQRGDEKKSELRPPWHPSFFGPHPAAVGEKKLRLTAAPPPRHGV